MLVDAHIRYRKPVSGRPAAVADMENLSGDLGRLAKGSKARIKLDVDICGDEGVGAVLVVLILYYLHKISNVKCTYFNELI